VCAVASTDPHCMVDPGTVPKTMDVLTPPGAEQSDLLDDTVHQPVTLEAVRIGAVPAETVARRQRSRGEACRWPVDPCFGTSGRIQPFEPRGPSTMYRAQAAGRSGA
jgi:hypothetical protein